MRQSRLVAADGFFADLPGLSRFADVMNVDLYRAAPDDWDVVVTDVEGSTKAIEAGRYKDVNALGVASIVALRNAAPGVDLPFVFGGDGATALVPSSSRKRVAAALRGVRSMAKESFGLGLSRPCSSEPRAAASIRRPGSRRGVHWVWPT